MKLPVNSLRAASMALDAVLKSVLPYKNGMTTAGIWNEFAIVDAALKPIVPKNAIRLSSLAALLKKSSGGFIVSSLRSSSSVSMASLKLAVILGLVDAFNCSKTCSKDPRISSADFMFAARRAMP